MKIFVYGTLMRGKSNYKYCLAYSEFLGEAVVEGFAMYDFGYFPGVVHSEHDMVMGELFEIDEHTLKVLDRLEGEGSLYIREKVNVHFGGKTVEDVFFYVYNGFVTGREKVAFENQPWDSSRSKEYVWYVGYGSNLLYDRFIYYIKGGVCPYNDKLHDGCVGDQSLPLANKPAMIPHKMYFGNLKSSWGPGGVSFLDMNDTRESLGRMYLVTKEQYEQIHEQESKHPNWYNTEVDIGELGGVKIKTITNSSSRPLCEPNDKYLNVVRMGIREAYPEMSEDVIEQYLESCME